MESQAVTVLPPTSPAANDLAALVAERRALIAFGRLALANVRPQPFMVDKAEAARLCGLSVATYDKYAKRGLLPALNAVGKISVAALKRACMKLDGLAETEATSDPAERALLEFERS